MSATKTVADSNIREDPSKAIRTGNAGHYPTFPTVAEQCGGFGGPLSGRDVRVEAGVAKSGGRPRGAQDSALHGVVVILRVRELPIAANTRGKVLEVQDVAIQVL